MIENFIKSSKIEYYKDVSLKHYNTYKLDVLVNYLVFVNSKEELIKLVKFLKETKEKFLVLGNGSNVIFKNKVYDGVIIKLDKLNKYIIKDGMIEAGAGCSLIKLATSTALMGLSGLEFASGIPGEIGASVAMNAGAYTHSLSEVVESVEVLTPDNEIVTMTNSECSFGYRESFFKHNRDYIIISCKCNLMVGKREEILELISNRRIRRIKSQPLKYPSAGSVFRNPEGMYAGKLIEDCGLKGYKLGGAMVSLKHANFIVNFKNATGQDIVDLINKIRRLVKEKYNVELVLEQIIID